jgi:hypothetical protein
MKNTYITRLPKTLLMITVGMLVSVNVWAQTPKSLTEAKVEEKLALNSCLNATPAVTDQEVKESKEWTAARKHVNTQSITSYTEKDGMELLAKVED